jgi:voltage-gated potassium channel
VSARRLPELAPRQRRRALAACAFRCVLATAAIVVLYYVMPLSGGRPDTGALIRLILGALLFTVVMALELRRILHADLPALSAVEALAVALPLFITLFAGAYVRLAQTDPGNFSEPLSRTSALYFAIVTLGTVGYGDITPTTDFARILVSVQVLVDLAFVGLVLRILVGATRLSLRRDDSDTR